MTIKYAITGNIASGKSAAENIIKSLGYKVLDTDELAHNILNTSCEIARAFSDYDVFENGVISRKKLGKLVFRDKELKEKLEDIIHPQIKLKVNSFFKENSDKGKLFVSIPLLFEANMQDMFDKIILIYTNDNIRLKRLIERDNYSIEYAKIRMNSQQSQDEKLKLCDYVVYNNSSLENLKSEISKLIL